MSIKNKVILFYNHRSGNGMFKNNLDKIISRYQKAGKLVIPIRAGENSLEDFLSSLDKVTYKDEFYQILVAGGDGTINICVNAMINNGIDLPLGVLPAGTANDFAYYFDLPNNIDKMLDITLGEKVTYADVGVVNGRYFINVAAIGQVVDVSQKTDPVLKNSIGVLAYYLKGLSEIADLKPLKVKLITDKKIYDEQMYFMVVMNGKSAGGFKLISPHSEINDGLLDVIMFRPMSMVEMPHIFVKILQGKHGSSKKVLHFKTDYLKIESDEDIPTDIDGEHGKKLPLTFSVLHKKLRILTAEDNMGIKENDE
ncbi:MAG: YegS/Rv2252/BmrU family lipid kinase [Eubacterium sp.]|nr:YegS/Rv2252/BmrU family lipid kinase [Eubacterium sp.]